MSRVKIQSRDNVILYVEEFHLLYVEASIYNLLNDGLFVGTTGLFSVKKEFALVYSGQNNSILQDFALSQNLIN